MILLGVIGGQEIILIAVVVLILFGGKKIPELMRGIGKGVKEYNKAVNDIKDQFNDIQRDINDMNQKGSTAKDKPEENKE